jgi:hypothetical protein
VAHLLRQIAELIEPEIGEEDERCRRRHTEDAPRHDEIVRHGPERHPHDDDEDKADRLDRSQRDGHGDRLADAGIEDHADGGQEREGVRGERCSGEVSEVPGEAEGDRARGQHVRSQHEPSRDEADRGPECERGVLELRGVPRHEPAQPRIGVRGESRRETREQKGQPQGIARLRGGRPDEGIDSRSQDDADAGERDLPQPEGPA